MALARTKRITYKGYEITTFRGTFEVCHNGNEYVFSDVDEAKEFIDCLTNKKRKIGMTFEEYNPTTDAKAILAEAEKMYKAEVTGLKEMLDGGWMRENGFSDVKMKNMTLDRMYGVQLFAQRLGVPYEEIGKLYDEYKEKVWNIKGE